MESIVRSAMRSLERKVPDWRKHRVHQRRLAMVDVGDDGDVAAVRIGDLSGVFGSRHPPSIRPSRDGGRAGAASSVRHRRFGRLSEEA